MIPDEGTIDPALAMYAMISWAASTDDPEVRRIALRLATQSAVTVVRNLTASPARL